jgi:hypothetical protein
MEGMDPAMDMEGEPQQEVKEQSPAEEQPAEVAENNNAVAAEEASPQPGEGDMEGAQMEGN